MSHESLCPLLDAYLELVDDTESPTLYHRWCMLSNLAAILNRRTQISMPTGAVYPNTYAILLGPPAARKSTAIAMASNLLTAAGYGKTASGSTTPQKFLADLYEGFENLANQELTDDSGLDLDLDGSFSNHVTKRVSDVLINAGELQDFLGINNFGFISLITNMFDNLDRYDDRIKTGKSNRIIRPTITLMGGATPTSFRKMFPIEILGQGLLSRFILVHGAGPRKKSFMPKPFDAKLRANIIEQLNYLLTTPELPSELSFTPNAFEYSRVLYESPQDEIADPRFQYYNGRRNTHYMKLIQLIAIANGHTSIEETDCLLANTILTYTEKFMPKALGEFGLDKAAEQTETVFEYIRMAGTRGITMKELVSKVIAVVPSAAELSSHIVKLSNTSRIDKIQREGTNYYIQVERVVQTKSTMVNFELLQEYRENRTFDTGFILDPAKLEAYELASKFKMSSEGSNNPDADFEIIS